MRSRTLLLAAVLAPVAAAIAQAPANMPSSTVRYATDAYPGFDSESGIIERSRKEPGFFSWWSGPKHSTPAGQLEWARSCVEEGKYGKAEDAFDALVAEWPNSPEAPLAQLALAETYAKDGEWQDAFAEYKYLLDFYPSQCDYDAAAEKLWKCACEMRREGKTIMFFRFANTTDVRRAFEAVVKRAPGASYAPAAMAAVAELREEDGELEKAILVYETLRNMYPRSEQAAKSVAREGETRMRLVRDHGYNRSRCKDTISYLKLSLASCGDPETRASLTDWLREAEGMVEEETYASARFYDSRTRTRRSAIDAYELFLRDYPAGARSDAVRERLAELKEMEK